MRNLRNLLVIITFIFGVSTTSAKAIDVGFAVGVVGNSSTFETSGNEKEGNADNTNSETETNSGSIANDVEFGSIFLESVLREGNVGASFGLEYTPGEASLGSQSRDDTKAANGGDGEETATYTGKAEVSDYIALYVEPTLYVYEGLGLFGKVGGSRVTVKSLESISAGTDSSAYGDEDIYGAIVGAGVRYVHSSGAMFKLAYEQTNYQTVTMDSTTGNKNIITADPEQKAWRISLGYQF